MSYYNRGGQKPTHDELANRWRRKHSNTAYGLGSFRKYKDGVWSAISDDAVKKEIMNTLVGAKQSGINPTKNLLSSVLELARIQIAVDNNLWDANPDILVFKNGTLNVTTMKVMKHSPENYVTSSFPYHYDPNSIAPVWNEYITNLDPDIASFLQEFAGYSLTVDTKHETALWLYGNPGSGKSTFVTGMQTMAGPKCMILGLAEIERSRFSLTNIPGKTLAISTEQPGKFMSATHILNAMISGETIPIEKKYHDPEDINPRVKIIWAMNELPRLSNPQDGLFRRIKVIPFEAIPKDQVDLMMKIDIQEEGPGILNWALVGLNRLRERGRFDVPPSISNKTKEFEKENDIPALFISERCTRNPEFSIQAEPLYDAYSYWCRQTGHKYLSMTKVAKDWERLGFTKYKSNGRYYYRGIRLNPRTSFSS